MRRFRVGDKVKVVKSVRGIPARSEGEIKGVSVGAGTIDGVSVIFPRIGIVESFDLPTAHDCLYWLDISA